MKKVKEMFFEDGNDAPTFILEDGEVRYPVSQSGTNYWITQKQIDELDKKTSKAKDSFWKKLSKKLFTTENNL